MVLYTDGDLPGSGASLIFVLAPTKCALIQFVVIEKE